MTSQNDTDLYAPAQLADSDVAIIGVALRFPGANSPDALWRNLRDGVESITHFSPEQLREAGLVGAELDNPRYVPARGVIDDDAGFDASFFGMTAREADILDPQQRLFLECAWEALECAGYNPRGIEGRVGVFASSAFNTYLLNNVLPNRDALKAVGNYQAILHNDKDFLATRVAYKLNLKGPCVTVQTACSSSLVAVHMAVQSLLAGECDFAIAGGASLQPQPAGYMYQEGGILSPDGHCRAFDAKAGGTVPGSGVGVVVLRRAFEAVREGDALWSMIKGSAVNNDGADKVGYTAPSVDGQAQVIEEALSLAEVDARTVGYIEAHGTGTELGDPVEVAALSQAFRKWTSDRQFCGIGSIKTNIGHLDTTAGVAGLIKASLALRAKQLPPNLHFESPNPRCELEDSPFWVVSELTDWPAGATPRRAAVSSFGMGG
ncbi:MAG: polyketide synthase, partial [Myxococcota bacterium]